MHTQRTRLARRSLFSTLTVLSPLQADLLKLTALLAMVTDHVNTILLQGSLPVLYAIGRMAFPLFTLIWAMHVIKNPQRLQAQAVRLWVWAACTQPVFWFAFSSDGQSWLALNILFLFAACTQALAWQHAYGTRGGLYGLTLLLFLAWPLTPASYGVPGIVFAGLTLLGFLRPDLAIRTSFTALWLLSVALLNGLNAVVDWTEGWLFYAALPAVALPLMMAELIAMTRPGDVRFLPKRFFYHAYAGHLLVLGVAAVLIHSAG